MQIIKYVVFGILILFILNSCNDKKTYNKHNFITNIELTVYKSDTIQLFYKTNIDDAYEESLSIRKPILGKPLPQTLRYELPPGVKPKNIRIDFGERPFQDSIRIHGINFQYKNLSLVGDSSKIKNWFKFNENIVPESNKGYKLIEVNGLYDPQINGTETLNKRLVKLFPPDVDDAY